MPTLSKTSEIFLNKPNPRFFVPDLSPRDRKALVGIRPRAIFVAESPHVSEIEPESIDQRRPLCGVAGRQWWGLLSELLDFEKNEDVSLEHLVQFCQNHRIVVMNAVQYPLDPKVVKAFALADPAKNLGFNKVSGPYSFKRLKKSAPVQEALDSLRARLLDPRMENAPIHCLGNDADWFVRQALGDGESANRISDKIPHPSAWWRRGGLFGRTAREKLSQIFGN
jgi:hypothetical protein